MYTIHVVAVNENGEGLGTREVTAKTYSDQPSEAPQNATLETASSTVSRHNRVKFVLSRAIHVLIETTYIQKISVDAK